MHLSMRVDDTVNRILFISLKSTKEGFISFNNKETLCGSLPYLSFNHNIVPRSFVIRVRCNNWFLVCSDVFEFPHNILILLVYSVIVNDIKWHNFFILIIIN